MYCCYSYNTSRLQHTTTKSARYNSLTSLPLRPIPRLLSRTKDIVCLGNSCLSSQTAMADPCIPPHWHTFACLRFPLCRSGTGLGGVFHAHRSPAMDYNPPAFLLVRRALGSSCIACMRRKNRIFTHLSPLLSIISQSWFKSVLLLCTPRALEA